MTVDELLPCPICGGKKLMHYYREQKVALAPSEWHGVIHCDNCGLTMTAICDSKDEAINEVRKRWNTRYERTCQIENLYEIKDGYFVAELSCNHTHTVSYEELPLRYCSDCGAKVVDDAPTA